MQTPPPTYDGRKPYHRFQAWLACHELLLAVYRVSESWPRTEVYGLTAQARRTTFSAAANIAEGSAKRGAREFRRFLDMSLGSLSELSYVLLVAKDLRCISAETYDELERLRDHASRLTWGLYWAVHQAACQRSSAGEPVEIAEA